MKSILLINPPSPWLISDRDLIPLGILYLASWLRMKGHEVKILDLSGGKDILSQFIPETDYYGISFVTPQITYVKRIIRKIRSDFKNAKIIAGGIHATSLPNETLSMGFDAVVVGEAEKTLSGILSEGLNNEIYFGEPLIDLNRLPFPSWDLIDTDSYVSNIGVMDYMETGEKEDREINIMATRGCPNKCSYCTNYKGRLRWRNTDNIIAEIKELQKLYHVNRISFCDDTLTIDKKWLRELCLKLKETGVKWHCLGRADQSDLKSYKLMKECGCMGIDFGIESGSQKILDLVNKNVTVERQEKGIRDAYEVGLKVRGQLMIGLPQESDNTIQETIDFINRNNKYVSKWGLHTFVPFPSCDIYQNPDKYKYSIKKDFENFQTIGKKGEWNYTPIDFKDKIDNWRSNILDAIKENNIQK